MPYSHPAMNALSAASTAGLWESLLVQTICRPNRSVWFGLNRNHCDWIRMLKMHRKSLTILKIARLDLWLRRRDLNPRPPGYEHILGFVKWQSKRSQSGLFGSLLPTRRRRTQKSRSSQNFRTSHLLILVSHSSRECPQHPGISRECFGKGNAETSITKAKFCCKNSQIPADFPSDHNKYKNNLISAETLSPVGISRTAVALRSLSFCGKPTLKNEFSKHTAIYSYSELHGRNISPWGYVIFGGSITWKKKKSRF